MGASLALSIQKKGFTCKITGIVRSDESKSVGIEKKIGHEIFTEHEFSSIGDWKQYDFIIFALPVDLILEKIKLLPNDFKGLITDLGSTKKDIIRAVENKFKSIHNYYSSHPMAGSEQTGIRYATSNLYIDRLCIMTGPKNVSDLAVTNITKFWNDLGSETVAINPEDHDVVLSYLSHSPHIISSLLVQWAANNSKVRSYSAASPVPLTGGGFRDMSRIAGSNPEMWEAIIGSNRKEIYLSLKGFRDELSELISQLDPDTKPEQGFWKKYFEIAKEMRSKVLRI